MALLPVDKGVLWVIIYILLITLLWPLAVLLVSIPLGQFTFFRKYIAKIIGRFGGRRQTQPVRIAIFASGGGSNALQIINRFAGSPHLKIVLIVCNKPGAGVLQIAADHHIPYLVIEKEAFFKGTHYLPELQQYQTDFIVLAGFLWKIPAGLIQAYPHKIVNIHPALLPKYGGKGMYGHFVHEAVVQNGEKETGITIHYVDEQYDHGTHIFQARCPVTPGDTPETVAQKVLVLEHRHFAEVIAQVLGYPLAT
ncbi:MAG: phosphoribosylglycinamide formyltransferase [Bacteroidetes bacterium]|nr:phosphoribosylglycinamide formyltransferase [Bacteroidota bacterium]